MHKIIKLPSVPEAVGILVVVGVGALIWSKLVPTSWKSKLG